MKSILLRRFATVVCALSFTAVAAPAAKIGVLLKGKTSFWLTAEKGAMDAGQKLGAEVVVKAPPTESDVALQVQLLNAMTNQGFDAIVIAPCNKDVLKQPTEAAAAKGIKIIVIDSALSGNASTVFIGTNQKAAGEAAGKLVASLVTEADEITILKHNQTGEATLAREAGALEKIREALPKAVVHADIYAATEKNVEEERAALVLSKYPKTKAILASSTPATMAMLKVLESKKPVPDIKFIGFGFNLNRKVAAALEAGTMHAWIAQQPAEVAGKAVQAAVALTKGETVAPVIYTDIAVITKASLADPKIQALIVD